MTSSSAAAPRRAARAGRFASGIHSLLAALALVLLTLAPAVAQTYTITTRAGNGTAGFGGAGGAATSAQLYLPYGVTIDGSGNVFIADVGNQRICKVSAATGVITTVAGIASAVGFSGDGGAATSARLYTPSGVAVDGSGNIFIADRNNNRIRRVSAATGVITTVAGTGIYGFSGDGGAATNAQFSEPSGVVVDGSGNVFIVDRNNHRIRRVSGATGVITTVAGIGGTGGFSGDGGAATNAQLNNPSSVAVDGSGNVFIADSYNSCIRKVSAATGVITTVAGIGGIGGTSGDGGAATSAQLGGVAGVAVDGSGNIFITDTNINRIRKVSAATGVITTVAGTGTRGFSGDGGPATSAQLYTPSGVAVDSRGNVFFADAGNNRIRQLTPAVPPTLTSLAPASGPVGTSVTLTGTGFTSASTVRFNGTAATSVTFTSGTSLTATVPPGATTGTVTVTATTGTSNGVRFTITLPVAPTLTSLSPTSGPVGTSVTLTGTGFLSGSTVRFNGTAATSVTVTSGTSLTATVPFGTTTGNVTVATAAGTSNGVRFTVTVLPDQTYTISTMAGTPRMAGFSGDGGPATSARLSRTVGVAVDGSGNVFIADNSNYRIRKVSAATGIITTVAGTGTPGSSGDGGAATSAQIGRPEGVAVDGSGNVFIADFNYNCIRKVSAATGVITTVAGNSTPGSGGGFSGDGGPATSALLNNPYGVAVDGSGNIFIADHNNYRIRRVSAATGVITTVAGTGTRGFSGDGGPATSAQLNDPVYGVAVDGSGNLFIADGQNYRIRKMSAATGLITTVAGTGTSGFSGDGGAATSAQLYYPYGLAVDGSGNIFFADFINHRIRRVNGATGVITTVAGTGSNAGGFNGDGGPATSARVAEPTGMALGASGKVFIAEQGSDCIRQLTPAGPAPTLPALLAAAVLLYPNPAAGIFTVLVPAVAGAAPVQAELLNALGQVVRHQAATAGIPFTVATAGLAPGVYALCLTAGTESATLRVVVE